MCFFKPFLDGELDSGGATTNTDEEAIKLEKAIKPETPATIRKVKFSSENFIINNSEDSEEPVVSLVNGNGLAAVELTKEELEKMSKEKPNFLVGDDDSEVTDENCSNDQSEASDRFNQNMNNGHHEKSAFDLIEKRKRLR